MKALVLFFASLIATSAFAVEAPRDFVMAVPTPTGRALGMSCYSMDTGDEALPCNPAFISREVEPTFKADILFGDNTEYYDDVTSLLNGHADASTVHDLFSESRPQELEGDLTVAYRRPTWGIGIIPYRVFSYFFVRNGSLPEVTLLAAQETSIAGQFGGYMGGDWSWGVQVRGVQRKYISQTFTLTDALAEGGEDLYSPQMQNALYIEPGLLKEWKEAWWRPQFTIAIAQFGFVDKKVQDFSTAPELHIGGAVHPDVGLGDLQLGIDAYLQSQTDEITDPLRVGATYDLGMMRLLSSFSATDYTLGFMLRWKNINGGLIYDSQYIEDWLGQDQWVRTTSLHVGAEF